MENIASLLKERPGHEIQLTKDIPLADDGKYTFFYLYTRDLLKKAGLLPFENGFDSIAIRIWFNYSFEPRKQVVEFRKSGGSWEADFILLTEKRNGNEAANTVTREVTSGIPKSGWTKFIGKLWDCKITQLPSSSSISGYDAPADGGSVAVEVATTKGYRFYYYSSPGYSADNIWQAKTMVSIMELIEAEFDFKRIRKM